MDQVLVSGVVHVVQLVPVSSHHSQVHQAVLLMLQRLPQLRVRVLMYSMHDTLCHCVSQRVTGAGECLGERMLGMPGERGR